MKPLKLIITDWCQHQHREIVFSEGLNAIVGDNGSGKTNILEALNLCLSLETNNPGKKTDSIRNGCDRASVRLFFEHQDVEGSIHVRLTRNYRTSWDELSAEIEMARRAVEANAADPSSAVSPEQLALQSFRPTEKLQFTLDWADVKCRKASEVAEFVRSCTQLDTKTIRSNYFPRQGDVDGAMSADREVRQRIFHEKAGTALCQKVWDELGKEQRNIPDFSQAEQALHDTQARLALTRAEEVQASKDLQELLEQPQDVEGPQEIVRRYMVAIDAKEGLAELQEEISRLAVDCESTRSVVEELTTKGSGLREEFDRLSPQVETWRRQIWDEEQRAKTLKDRNEVSYALLAAVKALEGMQTRPETETTPEQVSQALEVAATTRQTANQLEQWLRTFADGTCPTCGQAVDQQVVDQYQAQRQALPDPTALQTQAASLQTQLSMSAQAQQQWDVENSRLQAVVQGLEAQLQKLPAASDVQLDIQPAQQGLARHQQLDTELSALRTEHGRALERYNTARTAHELAAQRMATLMEVDNKACPTEQEFKEASDLLTAAQFVRQQLHYAELAQQVLQRRIADLEEEEKTRAIEAAKSEPSKRWNQLLLQARELLHQNNLPLQVVAWYAEQLAAHTQVGLDRFEAGYQLAVSPDLDLLGVFPDKLMSCARFSGGEKNMTNICMRLAMASLFPSDLQLLVLDEVEVHLDQDKVTKLPAILESVKRMSRERGLVVLFISHHPALVGISDRTIRID